MDISQLLAKYDRPVPRYTSYPPAPFFTQNLSQIEGELRLSRALSPSWNSGHSPPSPLWNRGGLGGGERDTDVKPPAYPPLQAGVGIAPSLSLPCKDNALLSPPCKGRTRRESQEAVSLYIHVPFCRALCHYCGCHTQAVRGNGPLKHFVPLLITEIAHVGRFAPADLPISQIHFGGGTPNILPLSALAQILTALTTTFARTADTEVAMECDPRLLTLSYITGLARLGFTRISLGVQDFDPNVQEAIGRIQSFEHIQACIRAFRMETIDDISLDLMTGLPRQTPESVAETAHKAADLAPRRLCVFSYAHVPWMKRHQSLLEPYGLPDRDARFAMTQAVKGSLCARGYAAIGIDHFAHPGDALYQVWKGGTMRRNFQGYTSDTAQTLIGFGPSAISAFKEGYHQNIPDTAAWEQAVETGVLPLAKTYTLTPDDKIRAKAIESIMCYGTAQDAGLAHQDRLGELIADGLVIRTQGGGVRITERGQPFIRLLAACFDAYYTPEIQNRHARSV